MLRSCDEELSSDKANVQFSRGLEKVIKIAEMYNILLNQVYSLTLSCEIQFFELWEELSRIWVEKNLWNLPEKVLILLN